MTYIAVRPPQSFTRPVRDLDFYFYRWSDSEEQPVLLLHGWGDTGATFQFLADHLPERALLAFDARGFGRTQWCEAGYWYPDYLADLDAIVDWLSPGQPIDLVGHSMGGNVALLYAGVRPQRIRRVVSLEGFGLRPTVPEQAPAKYREWLDQIVAGTSFASYDSFAHFARILERRHPRTSPAHLDFIARAWGRERDDGRIELRADPRHKRVNPALYRRDEAEACWKQITAPVLLVAGDQSGIAQRMAEELTPQKLTTLFRDVRIETLAGAGHMLHHEQPAQVAELLRRAFR
jgi:pimeloyl-ACP methyl ester carboxylesterase